MTFAALMFFKWKHLRVGHTGGKYLRFYKHMQEKASTKEMMMTLNKWFILKHKQRFVVSSEIHFF